MSRMKIEPCLDTVLIARDVPPDSKGGILLVRQRERETGTVIAVGPGREGKKSGTLLPMPVSVGERVLFERHMGTEIKSEGKLVVLIKAQFLSLAFDESVDVELAPPPPPPPRPDMPGEDFSA